MRSRFRVSGLAFRRRACRLFPAGATRDARYSDDRAAH